MKKGVISSGPVIICLTSFFESYANSAYPAQSPQNAESDQVLHCLLTDCSINFLHKMKNTTNNP